MLINSIKGSKRQRIKLIRLQLNTSVCCHVLPEFWSICATNTRTTTQSRHHRSATYTQTNFIEISVWKWKFIFKLKVYGGRPSSIFRIDKFDWMEVSYSEKISVCSVVVLNRYAEHRISDNSDVNKTNNLKIWNSLKLYSKNLPFLIGNVRVAMFPESPVPA